MGSLSQSRRFYHTILRQDHFSENYRLKPDTGIESLPSAAGVFFTVLLYLIVGGYAYQKLDVVINKKGVESMSIDQTNFYDDNYVFDQKQGLDLAVAFTDFDSVEENILDPSIG